MWKTHSLLWYNGCRDIHSPHTGKKYDIDKNVLIISLLLLFMSWNAPVAWCMYVCQYTGTWELMVIGPSLEMAAWIFARHYREKTQGLPPPNLRGGTWIYLHLRREVELNNIEPHGYNDESIHEWTLLQMEVLYYREIKNYGEKPLYLVPLLFLCNIYTVKIFAFAIKCILLSES